jgi:hypothetical protein
MDAGQWAYWATAVPVTVVVVLLGLVFTGEMRRLGEWLAEWLGGWTRDAGSRQRDGDGWED